MINRWRSLLRERGQGQFRVAESLGRGRPVGCAGRRLSDFVGEGCGYNSEQSLFVSAAVQKEEHHSVRELSLNYANAS